MPPIAINKNTGFWGLGLFSGLILLAWFFSGPIELAKNIESPGPVIPAGKRVRVDTRSLPLWWQEFDLRIRCRPGQDCAALRAGVQSAKVEQEPPLQGKEEVFFRLRINNPKTSKLDLINPGPQAVEVQQMDLRNYWAINTGFPRFSVLLSPFPSPGLPFLPLLGLSLGTGLLMIWNLVLLDRRKQGRSVSGFQWGSVLFPWLVLSLALGLRLQGRHLYLSWDFFPAMAFPGYLYWGLTSRFFQKKILVPLLVFLIGATFLVLLGTVLGVGLPVRDFGPTFIYQTHFTRTVRYAGLVYLVLSFGLYRNKKEWFSPDRHAFLASMLWVFFPSLIIYLANGFSDYGGDTTFNSLLPWRILQGEGLFFSKEYVSNQGTFGLLEAGEAFLPKFPIGPGFLGLPTALLQYFWSSEEVGRLISWNQKVTAVWVASLSATLIFQMVYILSQKLGLSLLLTAAFALGSTQATISAATLWQHGPAVLLLCLGLFILLKGQRENPGYYPLAALPLAFLPMMRPQTGLFYLAGFITVAIQQPKMIRGFLFWSLPGISLTLWINLGIYHTLLGGSGYQAEGSNFTTPLIEGAMGFLFSPNRGLFIFSPFLVLGVIGGGMLWAKRSVLAFSFGLAALLFFLVHAKWGVWHGGYCVTPRFTSELVPILVFFSAVWFLQIKNFMARLSGIILILISIAINLPGFFFLHEQGQWNVFPDVDVYRQERVWDYNDWLPIHFRHRISVERFKETPAYPFVIKNLEPIESRKIHYRIILPLNRDPLEIIKLSNILLKKGNYRILFKGDAQNSIEAKSEIIIGFIGEKIEEKTYPIDRQSSILIAHPIQIDKPSWIDVRLKVSGQGRLIVDTVQILPIDTIP